MSKRSGLPGSKIPPRSFTGFLPLGLGLASTRLRMLTPSTRAIASAAKNTVETLLFLAHAFQSTVVSSFLGLIAWLLSPDRPVIKHSLQTQLRVRSVSS